MTTKTGLELLREPFPDHQISKLPKPTKAQTEQVRSNFKAGIRCTICGAWHHPDVIHLDYVGHAALTDRLLDADPNWFWEPLALGQNGYPVIDGNGGMWIRLTVCGVTRLGYGHAGDKTGGDAIKEVIGDALRNAAMRFGAALDLWHKGDLHIEDEEPKKPVRLPALTDDEARMAHEKWTKAKEGYVDNDGDPDNDRIANEWGMLPSNVRSAIKRYGDSLKSTAQTEQQAERHMREIANA